MSVAKQSPQEREEVVGVLRRGSHPTDDLARRDADGYFWFVGRKGDVIEPSGTGSGRSRSSAPWGSTRRRRPA
jgi:acyl-coenzyme A synthetase/AMP-(fatty) acid ligase